MVQVNVGKIPLSMMSKGLFSTVKASLIELL